MRTVVLVAVLLIATSLHAETGRDTWLRYTALDEASATQYRAAIPSSIAVLGSDVVEQTAQQELIRGIRGMLGRTLRAELGAIWAAPTSPVPAILLGTSDEFRRMSPQFSIAPGLTPDAYWLKTTRSNGTPYILIAGGDARGVLYGAFGLLRKIALGDSVTDLDDKQTPAVPIRWVNEWNNLNGTIERGYGGPSIFWENGQAREDMSRVSEYGRMLASIGINGCSINNVNADPRLLSSDLIPQIARIANTLRPWGVKVAVAVDFGSPKTLGGLETFDPIDPGVIAWWNSKVDDIYRAVPDFGGFVLKADSEGRVGPSTYHRTHADAANVVARALKPHGGVIFYRGFVYDHNMDWARAENY